MVDFGKELLLELQELIQGLRQEANAQAVFLLDGEGHESHVRAEPVGAHSRLVVIRDDRSPQGLVHLRTARVLPRLDELWAAAGA